MYDIKSKYTITTAQVRELVSYILPFHLNLGQKKNILDGKTNRVIYPTRKFFPVDQKWISENQVMPPVIWYKNL